MNGTFCTHENVALTPYFCRISAGIYVTHAIPVKAWEGLEDLKETALLRQEEDNINHLTHRRCQPFCDTFSLVAVMMSEPKLGSLQPPFLHPKEPRHCRRQHLRRPLLPPLPPLRSLRHPLRRRPRPIRPDTAIWDLHQGSSTFQKLRKARSRLYRG